MTREFKHDVTLIYKAALLGCLLLFCQPADSQSSIDLYSESFAISRYDIDSCLDLSQRAHDLAISQKDQRSIDLYFYYRGVCYNRHGLYDKALADFDTAYSRFENRRDTIVMSDIKYQSALVHRQRTEHISFISKINQSFDLASAIGYKSKIGMCLNAKLIHYTERKKYIEAEDAGVRSLEIFQNLKDSSSMGDVLNNLGNLKSSMGLFEEALPYHKRQHLINQLVNNVWGLGYSHGKLGSIYLQQGRMTLADYHLNTGLELGRSSKSPYEMVGSIKKTAQLYLTTGNFVQALKLAHEAEKIAQKHKQGNPHYESLKLLADIYEAKGEIKSALNYQKEFAAIRNSTLNENIAKQLSEIETKYETEKKESEIQRLSLEDQLKETRISRQQIALGGSAFALALLSFLIYRLFTKNKQIRLQNKKITNQNSIITRANSENEILLKEIHHRVKNNLQVISSLLGLQSLSITDQKAKDAIQEGRSRVHSMSLIHQNLYKKDNLTGIEMEPYIKKLCKDLIQTYHIGAAEITFYEEVEEGLILDVETVVPLGLIINELVTNSLKYAFQNRRKGLISVLLKEDQKELLLIIKDNGIGLDQEILKMKKESFGHSLIRAFRDKLEAEMNITGKEGTSIELIIKKYKRV